MFYDSDQLESTNEEEKYSWTTKGTKLLLELYRERKDKFRDPKIKKRNLWTEIASEMSKGGYRYLSEDALDRKLRNLKKTEQLRTIIGKVRQEEEEYPGSIMIYSKTFFLMIGQ